MSRANGRAPYMLREAKIETGVMEFAEGSALVTFGHTKVICTASVSEGVPSFLKNSGQGWLSAEYAMLPKSSRERISRGTNGRSQEIQRLIGRALRAVMDLPRLGERTIMLDCDVLQADGGTRTAAITGAAVALHQALQMLKKAGMIQTFPMRELMAAISVGIMDEEVLLDLDYREDSQARVDMNVVMTASGRLVEVQGTAEHGSFSKEELDQMLGLAQRGIETILKLQKKALGIE